MFTFVRFLFAAVLLLTASCERKESKCQKNCPNGSKPVQCTDEPCTNKRCPKHPDATCVNDCCGGCNARFFNGNTEVTNSCELDCPNRPANEGCVRNIQCLPNSCAEVVCREYPEATCIADVCADCKRRWFTPKCNEVTDACNKN